MFSGNKKSVSACNMTETLLPRGSTLFEKQITVLPTLTDNGGIRL
ncbi:hypothetical protein B4144_0144 [Bacillus atrophaeus]|nr:hypothetical protein D068_cds00790 [Bacillus atrophaeus UCMB-5137]KYD07003.1 hypothetical protein B4144_0144 [Bacillus atrophaeus]